MCPAPAEGHLQHCSTPSPAPGRESCCCRLHVVSLQRCTRTTCSGWGAAVATPPHSWLKVNTIPYFGVGVGLGPGQEPQLRTVWIMLSFADGNTGAGVPPVPGDGPRPRHGRQPRGRAAAAGDSGGCERLAAAGGRAGGHAGQAGGRPEQAAGRRGSRQRYLSRYNGYNLIYHI